MNDTAQHKIYNIPSGLPFLKTLAQHLLRITDGKPEELTRYRVLLPTRRACRILRETFLSLSDGKPLLLPQMMPLGDVDEEDLSLMMFGRAKEFLDIPEAIAPMRRQLLLARLISSAPDFAQGPDHALMLAAALCKFIDEVIVEELDLKDLHKIVPEEFASHWEITLKFLTIISEAWPLILEEEGVVEAVQRRNLLLNALANHWEDHPPDYPIIAAGSTGSIPAAGRVLSVIAHMPQGRVILPGLDTSLDEQAWAHIGESHPQNSLKTLLQRIDAQLSDVKDLEGIEQDNQGRITLASTVMLPAQVTDRWKDFSKENDLEPMLNGVQYYSCETQREEALIISLMMRESLSAADAKSVTALVTPDRGLARRVSGICKRWGIEVDDSAGQVLTDNRLGKFISLSYQASCRPFDPVTFLALLKLSLCRFGYDDAAYMDALRTLEMKILRQDHIISSYAGLQKIIETQEEYQPIYEFLDSYLKAINPLSYLYSQSAPHKFSDILKAHIGVIENLAKTPEQAGADILWRGDVGEAATVFLTELLTHADLIPDASFSEYEQILNALMRGITVRSAYGVHPRLLILGQLEARLSHADLIILGGLNEGIWPPDTGHDPWMSRPMRKEFGLPGNDQFIGIAAHDFVQGFCAKNVVLTRSQKVDGGPTVPARWLARLETVMQGGGKTLSDLNKAPYIQWAGMLDAEDEVAPYDRPAPKPPVSTRPKGASVTRIDVWMKDPYAIYMSYVLGLRQVRPLVQDNDAALRGIILHEILYRFTSQNPIDMPDDPQGALIQIAKQVLDEKLETNELTRYWWPKFLKITDWFTANEQEWREDAKVLEGEIKGNIDLDIDGIDFNLYGTADRIDRVRTLDGDGLALIDYKTGSAGINKRKLKAGSSPQLPLEAVIASHGGFNGKGFKHGSKTDPKKYVPKGDTKYMGYWKMTGGRTPGEVVSVDGDLDETIRIVLDGLKELVRTFRDVDTPFYAVPDTGNAPRFNDYEHVSRLKEWAALDGVDEGGAD